MVLAVIHTRVAENVPHAQEKRIQEQKDPRARRDIPPK